MAGEKVLNTEEKARIGKKLGAVIKRARAKKGFLQKALAEKVGTSPVYLSQIERGVKFPAFRLLTRLASVLDTRASLFLKRAGILDTDEGKIFFSLVLIIEQAPDHKKMLRSIKELKKAIAGSKDSSYQ
jgi:transcriptional regulator with XRE-family HTH domain